MTGEPLGYWDYIKAAFRYRPRLGWLGPMPVNAMALFTFGLLGFFNPGFWLLGMAGEIGYLGFLSSNDSFQKVVQGQRLLQRQEGWETQVQRVFASLLPESRGRYARLVEQCGLILGITQSVDRERLGNLSDLRAGGLNQLLWLFLRLLSSRELIVTNLSHVDNKGVEEAIERLKERLTKAEPDSALARSLQGTLDIQLKRLENLTRAKSSFEVIDSELERIEQQVRLIREESAVSGGPEFLSARLDAVTSALSETSTWMDQHADFFGSLSTDEPDIVATSLPRISPIEEPPPIPPLPPRSRQKE